MGLNGFSQKWWTLMDVLTDQVPAMGHCGVRSLARDLVEGGSHNVFVYLFAHAAATSEWRNNSIIPHGADIPYTIPGTNYLAFPMQRNMTSSEARFALDVTGSWASFAMTGSPGSQEGAHWPNYDARGDELMALRTSEEGGFAVLGHHRKAACDYWAAHPQWPTARSSASAE